MDFASVTAFGRPVVQPSMAHPETLGVKPITDPRQAAIAATPLAAANAVELRVASGPRQSSSSSDARENKEEAGVNARNRANGHGHRAPQGEDRGASIDVTI